MSWLSASSYQGQAQGTGQAQCQAKARLGQARPSQAQPRQPGQGGGFVSKLWVRKKSNVRFLFFITFFWHRPNCRSNSLYSLEQLFILHDLPISKYIMFYILYCTNVFLILYIILCVIYYILYIIYYILSIIYYRSYKAPHPKKKWKSTMGAIRVNFFKPWVWNWIFLQLHFLMVQLSKMKISVRGG